jgi:peptidoglycan lytic transglycosylase
MRAFFAAVLTALTVAGGASLPAQAAPAGDLRAAGAHKGPSLPLLARATFDDDSHWKRPSYAKRHTKQRYGKHRWSRASKQARKGRVASGRATRIGRIAVKAYPVQALPIGSDIVGVASFYWQGQKTATGAWFNPDGMTAAHRTLPFGTKVRVTHLGSGRSVVVRINDRGPYIAGRIIDLSRGAAGVLGMQNQGVARVRVTVLGR